MTYWRALRLILLALLSLVALYAALRLVLSRIMTP